MSGLLARYTSGNSASDSARVAYWDVESVEKDGTEGMIPSIPAEHVVDTIGAGDSHAGSVIACLTNDMTLHDSIAYANKVAAATVGVKGMSLTKDQLPNM